MHASRIGSGNGFCTSLSAFPRLLVSARNMVVFSAFTLLLAACGGGGGSSAPNFSGDAPGSSSGSSGSSTGGSSTNTAPPAPVYSIGTGSGTGYKDGLIDSSKTLLNSGETATMRVNIVDQGNNPPSIDLSVSFSSTCSSSGLASFGTVTQVTRGLFSVDYTNQGCDNANDTVTALLTQNNKQATVKVTMVGPPVLSVSFVSATFTQLSLAGIGGNESSELTFKVAGPQGVPVVGKTVDFSINTKVGGATILSGRESGVTDQAGIVRTVINSGTIAGPVNVKGVERSTGRQGISSDIVISTGVADASRFSLSYTAQNPGFAWNTDGISVNVSIIASDIFGNNPTDGTRVSFISPESGNIQNSCLLTNGTCTVVWRSSGSRPADMRATVLAYTSGAEHFVDNNGNSVYDSSDVPITTLVNGVNYDTGEPYADQNENGSYDVGEYFFDTNKNGVRDGPNGQWDGPCLSKVDATAVCTGQPTVAISAQAVIVMARSDVRFKSFGSFPLPTAGISLHQGTNISLQSMVLEDGNTNADYLGGNPLPKGTTVAFTIDGSGVTVKGISSYTVGEGITPESVSPPMGITLAADANATGPAPVNVILKVTVNAPGLTTETDWPVTVLIP